MLVDAIGRRRMTVAAFVVFGLSGLWAGLATSMTSFLLARVVHGACFGAVQPTTIALVADALAGREQVKGQAHRYVGVATGDARPLIGGAVLLAAGWRSVVVLQVVTLVVALWFARAVPERRVRGQGDMSKYLGQFSGSLRSMPVLILSAAGLGRFGHRRGGESRSGPDGDHGRPVRHR